MQTDDSPIQNFLLHWKQRGAEAAANSGDLTKDQACIDLAAKAIDAETGLMWKGPINPQKPEDAQIVERVAQQKEQVRRLGTMVEHLRRRTDSAQESVPADERPPEAPMLIICAAIVALAVTFAMSLGELPLLEEIDDPVLRLITAAGMGGAIAATAIASMFNLSIYNPKASVIRPKQTREFWGFFASLIMVVAFGLIRFSTTADDIVLTAGLVAVDLATLLYAKAAAAQYRHKQLIHADRNDARIQYLKVADDARTQLETSQNLLQEANAEFEQAVQAHTYRSALDFDIPTVTRAAVSAFEFAYFDGLDRNRSSGVTRSTSFPNPHRRSNDAAANTPISNRERIVK